MRDGGLRAWKRTDSGLLRTDLEKTFERAQRHANADGQIDRRSTRD
jgi:hypothetical protein